jgi:ABC-type multidrug transport system fused ATPase/permease subunit
MSLVQFTASLDPENEIYIQQAIQELVKEKTVVVIAHKLQTIRREVIQRFIDAIVHGGQSE